MVTLNDVRTVTVALRGVMESSGATVSWKVSDKSFIWERPFTKADRKTLGASIPEGTILAVRVDGLLEKDRLLERGAWGCFTISHFDGYPAILVRLEDVAPDELNDLIQCAWVATVRSLPKRQRQSLE